MKPNPSHKISPYLALAATCFDPDFDYQTNKTKLTLIVNIFILCYESGNTRFEYDQKNIRRAKAGFDSYHTTQEVQLNFVICFNHD